MSGGTIGADAAAISALIGPGGQIVAADPPVMRLQAAAGGAVDGLLLVPQLAAVARLAQRLRILIARPVLAAGEGTNISMWVRAKPVAGGTELTIQDWRETLVPVMPLRRSERSADIAMAAEGWTWRTDAELRFTQIEDAAAEEHAPSPGAMVAEFFPSIADGNAAVWEALKQRRPFYGQILEGANGLTHRVSGHPVYDAQGSFVGYRGKAGRAEAEEAFPSGPAASEPDPADAASTQSEFALPAMPDFGRRLDLALRQPLGRIIANAETISGQLEGPLRTDYAAYAADIASAGRHLMGLVDDLADLQAIDRPNFQVAQEAVDLADIARRAAGLLGLKAQERSITIQPPATDENAPSIGEFRRALQIAVNLLGNAIRYGPENSAVWLRVDHAEADGRSWARLIVVDQGRGIAAEDQERVFEKFERLGREDAGGSGLGLYISRRLARAMGGDIHIDSAPGEGARFVLSLPAPVAS